MRRHGSLEALGRKLGITPSFVDPSDSAESRRLAACFATAYPALASWLAAAPETWRVLLETRLTSSKDARAHDRAFGKLATSQRQSSSTERVLGAELAAYVRRELLRIAYRELFAPGNPVADTARELSELADFAVGQATDEALAWARERYGLPRDEAGVEIPFTVLGMGKLGGRELNAGSDVDLVFFHGDLAEADPEGAEVFGRVGARIVATLETATTEGAAYRVDMRLRPEGKSGPLAHSLSRAERYYETWGRTWERVAFLRARPIAGSIAFGQVMLDLLAPFVWRRSVDPELPREVGRLVEQARAQRGARAAKRDLKIGPGGIREVEFFAQSLCLVWGGREPALRVRHTLEQVRKLRAKGYVTDREARDLLDAYVVLRSVEHRIQFATWEQTHDLPPPGELLDRVAASFGFAQSADFEARLDRLRRTVSEHFRRLTSTRGTVPGELELPRVWSAIDESDAEALSEVLSEYGVSGFDELVDQVFALARRPDFPLGKLTRERYPRFTEAFAAALFDAADPSMAARLIGQFFARLETPSVYVKLFEDEPRALLRFVSLAGGSSELGERLVGHPELVDGIVFATAEDPSAPLPDRHYLEHALDAELTRAREEYGEGDEALVAASRRLKSEITVRVGVRDLGGEASADGVASALTDLADVLVRGALEEASRRVPPFSTSTSVRGLAAMAMGKYGGRELSYGSDLDLFFVFDPEVFGEHEDSPYRIATRLLRLLSTAHGEGPGYELDTRLRPSGNQGLLVTSESAFARYHGFYGTGGSSPPAKAEAWERQALIKARFVAGDAALGARVAALAETIAYRGGAPDFARVVELRLRMEAERAAAHVIDIKLGPGGLVDIEFLAQALQMQHGADPRVRSAQTEGALRALWQIGALGDEMAQMLLRHHAFYRRLEQRLRIVYGRSDTLVVREGPQIRTLARRLGFFGDARRPEDEFVETLTLTMAEVRAAFLQVLSG